MASPFASLSQAPPPILTPSNVDGVMDIFSRYQMHLQSFRESDRLREEMVAHLVSHYQELHAKYQQKCDDYEQERQSLGMWQREHKILIKQFNELKLATESNPLVLVIIDGDGNVFRDDLLAQKEEGGAEAAGRLNTEIKNHLAATYPDISVKDWTIMVQVVINLEGMAKTLHATGILQDGLRDLTAFARAFGQAQSLFSFIDVGPGKERADHKIRETFRVMVRLTQCKHVIFGGCHDNGYLPVLEPYKRDPDFAHKISLLESTPCTPGHIQLGLRRVNFPTIFRSEPIRTVREQFFGQNRNGSISVPALSSAPPPGPVNAPSVMMSPQAISATLDGLGGVAALNPKPPTPAAKPVAPPPPPSAPPTTAAPAGGPPAAATAAATAAAGSSYATVSKTTTAVVSKTINIAPKKSAPMLKYYYINSSSERIDEELPRANPIAEKRYNEKRLRNDRNFCNQFHLLGYCDDLDEYCKYEHGPRLSAPELLVQQHRARGTYCDQGIECDDPNCYYSHHCRYGRECGLGHKCKFNDTHHMDLRKYAKIFEDGSREIMPTN